MALQFPTTGPEIAEAARQAAGYTQARWNTTTAAKVGALIENYLLEETGDTVTRAVLDISGSFWASMGSIEQAAMRCEAASFIMSEAGPVDLLREALEFEATAFDAQEEVDGADLLDWFADWRRRVAAVIGVDVLPVKPQDAAHESTRPDVR